jgi:hypothetical protein
MKYWRSFLLAVIAATFCFGGSCECKAKQTRAPRHLASLSR